MLRVQCRHMWPRPRTILLTHSIASWLAMSVMWLVQLSTGHNPPNTFHDPQFWMIFGFTEVAAPLILPIGALIGSFSFRPEMTWIFSATILAYSATATIAGS